MFHSWGKGGNLGNLDDSQEDGDARTGFLFVAKFYSVLHEMLAAYFEKISGTGADHQTLSGSVSFGSRPRFGDEVMEIGVAASDKCGIGEECGLVWCRVLWHCGFGRDGNWWIPCIIQPSDHPETNADGPHLD